MESKPSETKTNLDLMLQDHIEILPDFSTITDPLSAAEISEYIFNSTGHLLELSEITNWLFQNKVTHTTAGNTTLWAIKRATT